MIHSVAFCPKHSAVACLLFWGIHFAAAQQPILPPPAQPPEQTPTVSAPVKVIVRSFRFQGNTVFSSNELARLLEPYRFRELSSGDLEQARRVLTQRYINAGYVNSGALLEDQEVTNNEITFTIVEGRLSDVLIEGNTWLRTNYLRKRIELGAGPPLNIMKLQESILRLRDNSNLKQINAELKPGPVRGTALLDVHVKEASPWHAGLQARNDRPPSVGAEVLELLASHTDVTGNSDALEVRYGLLQRKRDGAEFSGSDNIGAAYTLPITPYDTTLHLYFDRNDYAVIEEPFSSLDLTSEQTTYGIAVRHPVYRTLQREIALGLIGEYKRSDTFLDGHRASFTPGAVDGRENVSALRFYQEWMERRPHDVLVFRSTFSLGLDILDATDNGTDRDGQFFTWTGLAQYVHRLGNSPHQLLLSASAQFASDPLLSPEQFSIGGANSVRGYRENQIVRDSGVVASAEFQYAVLTSKTGDPTLQLAPFFDFGEGWNVEAPTPDRSDIMSAGIGLIYKPCRNFIAKVYWGHPFRDYHRSDDLQDYGVHFRVNAVLF
jgi:hemolysin activation/secretion protein